VFFLGKSLQYGYKWFKGNHYSRKLTMMMPSEAEFKEILRNPYRDDPLWQEWADEESSSEDDDVTVIKYHAARNLCMPAV
jgi:hypothetical protein